MVFFVIVAFVCLSLLGCTSPANNPAQNNTTTVAPTNNAPQNNALTHTNSDLGYTISYPSDLNIAVYGPGDVEFTSKELSTKYPSLNPPAYIIRLGIYRIIQDPDWLVKMQRGAVANVCPGYTETKKDFTNVSGTVFECQNYPGGGYDRSFVFTDIDTNKTGMLELTTTESKEDIITKANENLDFMLNGLTLAK